jgi:hypothetical protein
VQDKVLQMPAWHVPDEPLKVHVPLLMFCDPQPLALQVALVQGNWLGLVVQVTGAAGLPLLQAVN